MKRSIMPLAGVATVFMVTLIGSSMVQDVVVTVDPTRTYQTMKGWEVSAFLWETMSLKGQGSPAEEPGVKSTR
jgi:hypothetical protein